MDSIIAHTDTASGLLQKALNEKAALPISSAFLENARAVLNKYGIPEVKNERYKYANIKRILNEGSFSNTQKDASFSDALLENVSAIASANTLVTFNGKIVRFEANEAFSISSITDFLAAHPEISFEETDAMQALNLLTATDGFYLKVNQTATEPLVWFNVFSADIPAYSAAIHAVTVANNAEADVLEVRIGKNQPVFANQMLQLFTRDSAQFRISVVDELYGNASGIFSTVAHQEKTSLFSHSIVSTNAKFVRENITAVHVGENCHTELNGFYVGSEERHKDFSTTVKHNLPNCTSDEMYKGVATDRSKAIFNGKVYVARDAQKTNAYQSNKNILLSDEALIRSKPELEIYADDVKCSHGSTTGQTDKKSLFYLQSRGIREKEAQKMLMLAFAGDVLERISNEEIRDYLSDIAENKLQEIF